MKKSVKLLLPFSALAGACFVFTVCKTHAFPLDYLGLSNVATLRFGFGWPSSPKSQTINLESDLQNTYTESSQNNTLFNTDLFFGYQRPFNSIVTWQLGVDWGLSDTLNRNGQVWQDADPSMNNFLYHYAIDHSSLGVRGVLLFGSTYSKLKFYMDGMVGAAFNSAYSFTMSPTLSEAVTPPAFVDNTTTDFTYAIGLGVQQLLNKHYSVGIGYQYADWGKAELGAAPGQALNQGITQTIHNNSVLMNLSYTN